MTAIYRGRRCFVVGRTDTGVWLEQLPSYSGPAARVHVSPLDPDLILDPSDEDMDLADAYERGEISAFEYVDGHTYPPGLEIGKPRRRSGPGNSS